VHNAQLIYTSMRTDHGYRYISRVNDAATQLFEYSSLSSLVAVWPVLCSATKRSHCQCRSSLLFEREMTLS
jgi:hypothetical protein